MRISDWSSDVCSSDLVVTHDLAILCETAGAHAFVVQTTQHQCKQCLSNRRGANFSVAGEGCDIAQLPIDRKSHTERGQDSDELTLIKVENGIGDPAAPVSVVDHLLGNEPIGGGFEVLDGVNAKI